MAAQQADRGPAGLGLASACGADIYHLFASLEASSAPRERPPRSGQRRHLPASVPHSRARVHRSQMRRQTHRGAGPASGSPSWALTPAPSCSPTARPQPSPVPQHAASALPTRPASLQEVALLPLSQQSLPRAGGGCLPGTEGKVRPRIFTPMPACAHTRSPWGGGSETVLLLPSPAWVYK